MWQRLLRVCALVRYRFFLYAGLLPYLLGAAWAYALADAFDGTIFLSGLAGVVLAVVGVEAFNEYFDSRMGTDRVFNPADLPPMTDAVLWLGIAAFAGALAVGIYLTILRGWPILAFALLGGAAAIFYVAPPIRWAYRGLGELVIALSYGPWMVLGSLYLHTQRLSWQALVVSLVPGCLIMGLAVVNAIPDFHQDRLVGKRNLVVRRRAPPRRLPVPGAVGGGPARSCRSASPPASSRGPASPPCWRCRSWSRAAASRVRPTRSPRAFVPAVRNIVACYLVAVLLLTAGIIVQAGWPLHA